MAHFIDTETRRIVARRLHHRRGKSQGHQDDPGRASFLGVSQFPSSDILAMTTAEPPAVAIESLLRQASGAQ